MALWQEFRRRFAEALDEVQPQHLEFVWRQRTTRTAFYAGIVLERVAHLLNLEHAAEFLNIDHVLLARRQTHRIPQIFLESENDATGAHEEVRKLCAVSAPLRVLLTVVEWDVEEGVWPSPGNRRDEFLRAWGAIAAAHNEVWRNRGVLALLVGELCDADYLQRRYNPPSTWLTHQAFRSRRLRFYAHHFDFDAGQWPCDGVYQRYLAGPMAGQAGDRLPDWPPA
jgi:hypothetical protein